MAGTTYSMNNKSGTDYWRISAIILLLVALSLGIALVVVSVNFAQTIAEKEELQKNSTRSASFPESKIHQCGSEPTHDNVIDVSESDSPGIFSDLTKKELEAITKYLFSISELNLVPMSRGVALNNASLYLVELLLPDKYKALLYLESSGPVPERWAKAIIFRGDLPEPEVQEYKVGPLPNPNSHTLIDYAGKRTNPVPFDFRPLLGTVELLALTTSALLQAFARLSVVLYESFGVDLSRCNDKCITISPVAVSTSNFGSITRATWVGFNYQTDFFSLYPVDLQILFFHNGADVNTFRLSSVWYNQQKFNSVDEFLEGYKNGSVDKIRRTFPKGEQKTFGTMDIRGNILEKESLRPPRQIEPDGKRYSVKHQRVEYLGWTFSYRMSTIRGPMLLNVQYRGDRIAYEISLQEISVLYSGNSPLRRFSDFMDSFSLLGSLAKVLVPGGDCPYHASFLPARHQKESDSSTLDPYAFCLFEQGTGVPLRRHHSYFKWGGSFYNGMLDDVLTLRTIITVANYDYIIDFIFHQNGALEVEAISTGYIVGSVFSSQEKKYGFRVQDKILGNIHHHLFNFKVDLDINGVENRFETLAIEVEETPNTEWSSIPDTSTIPQIIMNRTLKTTEKEAAYKFKFDAPKYLIFYNENVTDKYGNQRAYRLAVHGMSKQTIPEGRAYEPSVSWARYQTAVTRFHQHEQTSSSIYSQVDTVQPVVNFQSYIDNNENIMDQDLVAWVTMGVHHIPHTEDLPVTPTPGGHLTFVLAPHNYFREDPSMASRSAIRIALNSTSEPPAAVINRYGLERDVTCVPRKDSSFDDAVKQNRSVFFSEV